MMLQMYGPALLAVCRDLTELSENLVTKWLGTWMLAEDAARHGKSKVGRTARSIARKLARRSEFLSHGRHVRRDQARTLGLVVDDLEADETFQDLVLSVFHATTHTFSGTNAVKIIENHKGNAFVKTVQIQQAG